MPYSNPEKQKEYQREWMKNRRAKYVKNCSKCNASDELEVHHKDPDIKVSHRIWSWREDRIIEELAKCDILCRECHDKQHGLITNPDHGTTSRYTYGCRCDLCKLAKSKEDKEYYARTISLAVKPLPSK